MKKLMVAMIPMVMLAGCGDLGSSEKLGTIVRLQQRGIFCKTWEAEIVRGGYSGGSGVQGTAFHFTIENPQMLEQVKASMENQTEVKITTHEEMMTVCRSESGDNFLTSIVEVKRPTTTVTTQTPAEATGAAKSNEDDITQLLRVQAELIAKIAAKQK